MGNSPPREWGTTIVNLGDYWLTKTAGPRPRQAQGHRPEGAAGQFLAVCGWCLESCWQFPTNTRKAPDCHQLPLWKAAGTFQRPRWKAVGRVQRSGRKPIGRSQLRASFDTHLALLPFAVFLGRLWRISGRGCRRAALDAHRPLRTTARH